MNHQTPYELTIAEKLGHLQVPDLRDAIWKRIEDQLDLELPTDDQPGEPDKPQTPDWISITKRFGSFAVIVAVIATIFIINKKHPSEKTVTPGQAPAAIEQSLPPVESSSSPPGERDQGSKSRVSASDTADQQRNIPFNQDDVLFIPSDAGDDNLLPKKDTVPQQAPVISTAVKNDLPPAQDSTPKKSRGFKGMKDDDYRISLKKDSVP